jgi:hypothetical protein
VGHYEAVVSHLEIVGGRSVAVARQGRALRLQLLV